MALSTHTFVIGENQWRKCAMVYSKFFRFLATTTEKSVIWVPELRLQIRVFNTQGVFRTPLNFEDGAILRN